ncbi:MAG: immunoglobulin domain-containing protein [Opitutaceae bacterium]|nr:immunoglobulin domain-containing protein [Opitutaceae bacterium]
MNLLWTLRLRAGFGQSRCVFTGISLLALAVASLVTPVGLFAQPSEKTVYFWSVFSGRLPYPNFGSQDGPAGVASFNGPAVIAISPTTGRLYLTDSFNETVREIAANGSVSTFAGFPLASGFVDGVGPAARFHRPVGITVDRSGTLYVVEEFNGTVRKITPTRSVTTVAGRQGNFGQADGTGTAAQFYFPRSVAVDASGTIYVADTANNSIRKVTPSGNVTTFAGLTHPGGQGTNDGTGQLARFNGPDGLAFDPTGNLIVADSRNHLIRRVTPAGVVTTVAGGPGVPGIADGPAATARFRQPYSVAVDASGTIFVADTFNSAIRMISPQGVVKTIGGKPSEVLSLDLFPGLGANARLARPTGIVVDARGNLFMVDGNVVWRGEPMLPPEIVFTGPNTMVALEGETVTLNAVITGTPAPTLQWLRNGTAIPGATRSNLTLVSITEIDAALYSLVVTSPAGAATANITTIRLGPVPVITQPLQALATTTGGSVLLQVSASGRTPLTYVWRRDGVIIPNASDRLLLTSQPGAYTVTVSNSAGEIVSSQLEVASRLVNVSALASTNSGGTPLIVGFVIDGLNSAANQFLIRGVGPTLAAFGVPDAMREPILTAYRGSEQIGTSAGAGWSTEPMAPQISAAASAVGAFALPAGSRDAALLQTVGFGAYTVHVSDRANGGGSALMEVYDASGDNGRRLSNLSFRGNIARGSLTVGFVIRGHLPAKLLVRAVGPTLVQFGVSGALARTRVTLRAEGSATFSNTGWETAVNAAEIASAAAAAGAFALPVGSADSALLVMLNPGAYTAEVGDASGAPSPAGEALVEVYHLPSP